MLEKMAQIFSYSYIAVMALAFIILFHLFFFKTGFGRQLAVFLKRLLVKKKTKPVPGSWGTDIRVYVMKPDQESGAGPKKFLGFYMTPETVREIKLFLLISGVAIGSRLMLYVVAYLGAVIIAGAQGGFFQTLKGLWNQWDSGMYIFIAENWYVTVTDKKYLIVFFPLFPIMMKLFSLVLKDFFVSGIVVSNLSLCFSCYYLYKLVRLDYNKYVSCNAVKYLLIFPFSFFLGACFSDGLFLALSIMSFYYMRKQKWLVVGICGFLATLTRNFGILLIIPAVIEYLSNQTNYQPFNLWRTIRYGLSMLLIPLGYGVYLLINKLVTGSWTTFLKYQEEYWYHQLAFFPDLGQYFLNIFNTEWSIEDRIAIWIPQLTLIIIVAGLIFYALKKIRYSYIVYMFIYLLLCLSMTWLLSGARYILGIVPLYLLLALLSRNRYVNMAISFISYILLGFYTVAFVIGYRVM